MTEMRKDAMDLLERMQEDKLYLSFRLWKV